MRHPVLNLPFTQQTQRNLQAWGSTPWASQDQRGSSGEGTGAPGNPASALRPDAAYSLYQRGPGCAGKGGNCSEVGWRRHGRDGTCGARGRGGQQGEVTSPDRTVPRERNGPRLLRFTRATAGSYVRWLCGGEFEKEETKERQLCRHTAGLVPSHPCGP